MLDVKPRPRTQAKAQPVKGWRNYYRIYRVLNLLPFGTVFPGMLAGPTVFDSKEIAENHAAAFLSDFNHRGRVIVDHVGAYQEGGKLN